MSLALGDKLREIREKLGFSSARSFYAHLEKKADLDFNYAYYMKIEKNEKLPSPKVLQGLASLVPDKDRDALVLCYCQQQFPNYEHLFQKKEKKVLHQEAIPKKKKEGGTSATLIHQKELTERQVAVLAESKFNFFLFSLITLARFEISYDQLLDYFTQEEADHAISQLQKVKLLQVGEERTLASSYPEFSYPKAISRSLQELYQKLDEYEKEKLAFFKLTKKNKAHFFRRISPRYLELLQGHIQLLYQAIRMSDEHDVFQNDGVCSLEIRLDYGELPG